MNNLIDKLKKFVDDKKPTDIIPTTLREVREIYRPREQYPKTLKLIYHIFNSIYNRIPNFKVKSVLIDKMEYAFRIGTGMASYNTLPLTWLQDSIIKFKNFLMKDRPCSRSSFNSIYNFFKCSHILYYDSTFTIF